MTILGRHTVAEVRSLMRTVQYNFEQVQKAWLALPISSQTPELAKQWEDLKQRWKTTVERVSLSLKALMAVAPTSREDLVPAEDDWGFIYRYTYEASAWKPGEFQMVSDEIQKKLGKPIDYSARPTWTTSDADFDALKKIDKTEEQVKTVAKPVGIGLGVFAVIAAFGVGYFYVRPFLPSLPRKRED